MLAASYRPAHASVRAGPAPLAPAHRGWRRRTTPAPLRARRDWHAATGHGHGSGSSSGHSSPSWQQGGNSWLQGGASWQQQQAGDGTSGADAEADRAGTPAPQASAASGAAGSGRSGSPAVPGFLASLPVFGGRPAERSTPLGSSIAARLRGEGPTGSDGGGGGAPGGASGGGAAWSFRPTAHADGSEVAPWVIAALAPVVIWSVTWALTAGLAHLAEACMGGMCSIARVLFPTLPLRGVSHEDVAVSLVKSMQAGTVDDDTWCRPGLLIPGFVLQALMRTFFGVAAGSTSIAASLGQVGPWMAACGLSQALLCVLCLLIALPVGTGLHALMQQVEKALGGCGDASGDAAASSSYSSSSAAAPPPATSSSSTALSLKLAATLAWPCISAAAVGGAVAARALAAPPLALALLQALAAASTVALALTTGLAAARYAREIGLGHAGDAAAVDFGLQVGLLCAAQAGVNALHLLLGLAGGGLALREVVFALLCTSVLARVAATVWVLQGEAKPTAWLQLLTLDTLLARGQPPAKAA